MNGIVCDIQRAALHDGPGIRTAVFLKGCPLRCAWCHNPESQKTEPETAKSGRVYGRSMSVDEVMQTVRADRAYYDASGGGLTLSGGEPTVQFDFCMALLEAAKSDGIHTCIDTCGQVDPARLAELIPLVDLFHFDWKLESQEGHDAWTGGNSELIRDNLDLLIENRCRIILRCPIIPGINDTREHKQQLDAFERSGAFIAVERLPYHTIGDAKYADLGRPNPMA